MRDAPMLAARNIVHRYGGVLALNDVSLEVSRGEFVSVLGANGAGKTTLGLIMSGAMAPTSGEVACDGSPAGRRDKPLRGVSIVPEGRRLFGQLTVRENLLLGGYGAGASDAEMRERMSEILASLPKALRDDPGRFAATLSGGEQQMLAIGRALMARPRALIIDEPSMGLAPILIEQVYATLTRLRREGLTIVLFEQMATQAVRHSDRLVVLERGRVVYSGSPRSDAAGAALLAGYIGKSAA
ncbi:ABC transporter ATP-binding protein [Terrarubrum flagellatum]|uniref:ABC transporter ATP-binding protein n=1 Tax=Terrirubrum flagellatum TaxID=2895980 RepID=UPI003145109B